MLTTLFKYEFIIRISVPFKPIIIIILSLSLLLRKPQPEPGKCVLRKVCPKLFVKLEVMEKQQDYEITLCILSFLKSYDLPVVKQSEFEFSMLTKAAAMKGNRPPAKDLKVNKLFINLSYLVKFNFC